MAANPYVPDFSVTDAELLLSYKAAAARIAALGQSYVTVDGRRWTGVELEQLEAAIRRLEDKIEKSASGIPSNRVRLKKATG